MATRVSCPIFDKCCISIHQLLQDLGDDMSANDDHPELRPKSSTSRHESLQGNELIMFCLDPRDDIVMLCLDPGDDIVMFCLDPDQLTEKNFEGTPRTTAKHLI